MSGMKLKKVAYCSTFSYFFLPSMQEIVDEAILQNTFSKVAYLYLESCSSNYFLKKSFTSKVELCQTGLSHTHFLFLCISPLHAQSVQEKKNEESASSPSGHRFCCQR